MPFITLPTSPQNGTLLCWELSESLIELQSMATTSWLEEIGNFKNERRKKEYLACRLLFAHQMGHTDFDIQYTETGAPYIPQINSSISISHSKELVVVYLHTTMAVGVDIEIASSKLKRIQHKFLAPEEYDLGRACFPTLEIAYLTLCWSAKEAMYKWYTQKGLSFRNQLRLESFHLNDSCNFTGHFEARIQKENYSKPLRLDFFSFREHMLVYVADLRLTVERLND